MVIDSVDHEKYVVRRIVEKSAERAVILYPRRTGAIARIRTGWRGSRHRMRGPCRSCCIKGVNSLAAGPTGEGAYGRVPNEPRRIAILTCLRPGSARCRVRPSR